MCGVARFSLFRCKMAIMELPTSTKILLCLVALLGQISHGQDAAKVISSTREPSPNPSSIIITTLSSSKPSSTVIDSVTASSTPGPTEERTALPGPSLFTSKLLSSSISPPPEPSAIPEDNAFEEKSQAKAKDTPFDTKEKEPDKISQKEKDSGEKSNKLFIRTNAIQGQAKIFKDDDKNDEKSVRGGRLVPGGGKDSVGTNKMTNIITDLAEDKAENNTDWSMKNDNDTSKDEQKEVGTKDNMFNADNNGHMDKNRTFIPYQMETKNRSAHSDINKLFLDIKSYDEQEIAEKIQSQGKESVQTHVNCTDNSTDCNIVRQRQSNSSLEGKLEGDQVDLSGGSLTSDSSQEVREELEGWTDNGTAMATDSMGLQGEDDQDFLEDNSIYQEEQDQDDEDIEWYYEEGDQDEDEDGDHNNTEEDYYSNRISDDIWIKERGQIGNLEESELFYGPHGFEAQIGPLEEVKLSRGEPVEIHPSFLDQNSHDSSLSILVFYSWIGVVTIMVIGAFIALKHRHRVTAVRTSWARRRKYRNMSNRNTNPNRRAPQLLEKLVMVNTDIANYVWDARTGYRKETVFATEEGRNLLTHQQV